MSDGPRRAKNRLSDMDIDFVSLVEAGDNEPAEVVLWKSRPAPGNPGGSGADGEVTDMATRTAAPAPKGDPKSDSDDGGAGDEVTKYVDGLEDENDLLADQNVMLAKALQVLTGVDPLEDPDAFTKAVAKAQPAKGKVAKAAKGSVVDPDEDEDADDDDEADDEDEASGAADGGDDDDEDEPVGKAKGGEAKGGELDDLLKANPVLSDLFKGMERQVRRSKAEAQVAKNIAERERGHRLSAVFKARGEALSELGEPDEIGGLMADLYKHLPEELYKSVEQVLVEANEKIAEGGKALDTSDVFTEFGKNFGGADADDDPLAAIAAQVSKTLTPGQTLEDAITAQLDANPEAYDRHESLRRAKRFTGKG